MKAMERKTGFEPAALAVARRCSTAALLPLENGAAGQNRTGDTRIFNAQLIRKIKATEISLSGFIYLAPRPGLEPGTHGLTVRCYADEFFMR